VADSEPEKEYAETRNKAAVQPRAIDLAHEQFGDGGPS
jgi:anthranilate/para-aminobenzoate synthase component I